LIVFPREEFFDRPDFFSGDRFALFFSLGELFYRTNFFAGEGLLFLVNGFFPGELLNTFF
jgi:hypothetical protein